MARGWESKSVESQQADHASPNSTWAAMTPEQTAASDRRKTLELAHARATADLAVATRPGHRAMLETTLAALDRQIGELTKTK
jgi:hypothetical protein